MSRLELTRRIGMERKVLFGLVVEPVRWPIFYNNMVSVGEPARFERVDDQVEFEYRVLGRVVQAKAQLIKVHPSESVELEARVPPAVKSRQRWEFRADGGGTLVSVRLEVNDVTNWFGVPVDRFVVGRALQADLSRTLDNLTDLVAVGLV